MRKYEIVDVNHVEVTVDVSKLLKTEEMFFNATVMAKQFDKQPSDYLRLDGTKEYVDEVSSNYGISPSILISTKQGKHGGTYLHNHLAIDFARWLSPKFAVRLDQWVVQKLKETQHWKQARLESKTGFLPMTEAVTKAHNPVKFYHYSTEANLINIVLTGMSAKKFKELYQVDKVRDALTQHQLDQLNELQTINTTLIKLGTDYQERKEVLTNYYNTKLID